MPRALCYAHAYPGSGFMAGGETTLHDMNVALVKGGWQVDVLFSEPFKNGSVEPYTIDGVNVIPYTDIRQPLRLAKSYDLLISHLGGAQRMAILSRKLRIPNVQVAHNDLDFTKSNAQAATMVVWNTDWVRRSFETSRIRTPGIVVHPPVNPELYRVRSKRQQITLVNLSNGGGGVYDKGAKTFWWLAEQFPDQQFLGVKGAYGEQEIHDLPNVEIMENMEDIRVAYRKTKIVLSPSNYESYGRISVEAACSGIPSITSTAPGFEEHKVTDFRVPFNDNDSWKAALEEMLATYDRHTKVAKERAEALWVRSQEELAVYVERCGALVRTRRR